MELDTVRNFDYARSGKEEVKENLTVPYFFSERREDLRKATGITSEIVDAYRDSSVGKVG
jgi:hypothetical protein